MNEYSYEALTAQIEKFITEKHLLGYHYDNGEKILLNFAVKNHFRLF